MVRSATFDSDLSAPMAFLLFQFLIAFADIDVDDNDEHRCAVNVSLILTIDMVQWKPFPMPHHDANLKGINLDTDETGIYALESSDDDDDDDYDYDDDDDKWFEHCTAQCLLTVTSCAI